MDEQPVAQAAFWLAVIGAIQPRIDPRGPLLGGSLTRRSRLPRHFLAQIVRDDPGGVVAGGNGRLWRFADGSTFCINSEGCWTTPAQVTG